MGLHRPVYVNDKANTAGTTRHSFTWYGVWLETANEALCSSRESREEMREFKGNTYMKIYTETIISFHTCYFLVCSTGIAEQTWKY